MTTWVDIPDGYYATPDPNDPTTITYWRRHSSPRDNLKAWPAKAAYGPRATQAELNAAPDPAKFMRDFSTARNAYYDQVVTALLHDTHAAARRFAELSTRCCICAHPLRDNTSKTYGIGPECRTGIPADTLARYFTPRVGRAHATHLAKETT